MDKVIHLPFSPFFLHVTDPQRPLPFTAWQVAALPYHPMQWRTSSPVLCEGSKSPPMFYSIRHQRGQEIRRVWQLVHHPLGKTSSYPLPRGSGSAARVNVFFAGVQLSALGFKQKKVLFVLLEVIIRPDWQLRFSLHNKNTRDWCMRSVLDGKFLVAYRCQSAVFKITGAGGGGKSLLLWHTFITGNPVDLVYEICAHTSCSNPCLICRSGSLFLLRTTKTIFSLSSHFIH